MTDRAQLAEASLLAVRGAAADRDKALEIVHNVAARHPDDSALGNLARRMAEMDEGGTYVLG